MSSSRLGPWRNLPRNSRLAVRMIRKSAPREYRLLLVAASSSSIALVALMFSGRELIQGLSGGDPREDASSLIPIFVVLGIAMAVIAVANVAQTEVNWLLGFLVEQESTGSIVHAAASVPLAEFESPEFQDHLQRSLRQAVHRPWEITQAVGQVASAASATIAIVIVLFAVQAWLAPAVLLVGVPMAFAATRNSRALYEAFHAITPISRERQYLQDVLTGRDEAKEVRAFDTAGYLRDRFNEIYRREIHALRTVARMRSRRARLAGLAATAIVLVVLVVLVGLSYDGRISLADAAIGAVAVQQLAMRVRGINSSVGSIQEASLFLEDYSEFLVRAGRQAREDAEPDPGRSDPTGASVALDDVWFTYPGAESPALRGVSLSIAPGEVVALVGANGSGKTTIAKLVCDLYKPQQGTVGWGSAGSPRVGVIFQDFMRYELSARENIALGDAGRVHDDKHVVASAQAANADEFLAELPDGYDTRLSPSFESGTDLSVGQWQRVAMARALFRDAPVLVLDEPTASLDPAAERELIDGTRRMFTDKAVLLISHRFANVVDADRIYVLGHGQVVEEGTHQQLMNRRGLYAEMYRVQASTFGVDVRD